MIMSGNEMKWASVEATQGTYTWGPADQMVAFATADNERARGHYQLRLPGHVDE